jgi:hypothetical protein
MCANHRIPYIEYRLTVIHMSEKFKTKVLADGRITIPLLLRRIQGIKTGDIAEPQLLQKITVPVEGAVD